MAKDFDEVDNPWDSWIADTKGKIRNRFLEKKGLMWQDIAADTGLSFETVRAVMRENNVRHTLKTLLILAAYFDIRVALIDGAKSRRQPRELRPLTEKQLAWIEREMPAYSRKIKGE